MSNIPRIAITLQCGGMDIEWDKKIDEIKNVPINTKNKVDITFYSSLCCISKFVFVFAFLVFLFLFLVSLDLKG